MTEVVALGIMSGTSCDGVDAVLVQLASVRRRHEPVVLGHRYLRFPPALRTELTHPENLRIDRIAELHYLLPELYAKVARAVDPERGATVCGMHGQTVWHAPPPAAIPCTLQIGSSALLAQRLGIPVVGDLRGADLAHGGQGAPIVPFSHWFFTHPSRAPRLIVNFGGICNITYVARALEDVRAYDVGPGMMLSDAFAVRTTNGELAYDRSGSLSQAGQPIPSLVEQIASHPFVARKPPKSTGREAFGAAYYEPLFREYASARPADVARSLIVATAEVLARTVREDPAITAPLRDIVLSGGGAKNPVLASEVQARFPGIAVVVAERGVFAPEHHEPAGMALIAARTLAGLASSLPRVTGAAVPVVLGHVHRPTMGARM